MDVNLAREVCCYYAVIYYGASIEEQNMIALQSNKFTRNMYGQND